MAMSSSQGHIMFVLPWHGQVLISTTDTAPGPTYVLSVFAGVRPLARQDQCHAHQQWILNAGSYSNSWNVQVDVQVDNSAIGTFFSGSTIPDVGNLIGRSSGTQLTTSADAALRIEFDASTKIMPLLYDVDGGLNGYSWLPLVQAYIDDGLSSWNMTDSDRFELHLNAVSFTPTAAGEIFHRQLRLHGAGAGDPALDDAGGTHRGASPAAGRHFPMSHALLFKRMGCTISST